MIGLLIFTHGRLCHLLLDEAKRIAGNRQMVECLSTLESVSIDELQERTASTLEELDSGAGVLVLCDVVGGTPWNVAGRIAKSGKTRIRRIAGVNDPLVIKVLQDRGENADLDRWARLLVEYGRKMLAQDSE